MYLEVIKTNNTPNAWYRLEVYLNLKDTYSII